MYQVEIPAELRGVDQWIMWEARARGGGKVDKIPVDPVSGRRISAHEPGGWLSYSEAIEHQKDIPDGSEGGIGFVITEADPFCCIDIDDAVDGSSNLRDFPQWVARLVGPTYAEWSPSGKGLHIWVRGSWPGERKRGTTEGGDLWEVYDSKQFLTVTGEAQGEGPPVVSKSQGGLDAMAAELSPGTRTQDDDAVGNVEVAPDPLREPSISQIEALQDIEVRFKLTWQRRRKDKAMADQSASGYCLSIANTLVKAGWGDQQICDALLYWRRKHGESLKLNRGDNWYARTIARARCQYSDGGRLEVAEEVLDDPEATHEERFGSINQFLGPIAVVDIVRYPTEVPTYRLTVVSREGPCQGERTLADLGDRGWFSEHGGQRRFRQAIGDACRIQPPALTPGQWQQVSSNLLLLAVDVDVADGSPEGQIVAVVQQYLLKHPPGERSSETLQQRYPIISGDGCSLFASSMLAFASRSRLSVPRHPYPALRGAGFRREQIAYAGTSTAYWRVPTEVWEMSRMQDVG